MDAIHSLLKRVAEHQSFEGGVASFTPHKSNDCENAILANHQNYRRT